VFTPASSTDAVGGDGVAALRFAVCATGTISEATATVEGVEIYLAFAAAPARAAPKAGR
jgi:hypothetical protein